METIETLFAREPADRAFRVTFRDGDVFVIDNVLRGQDQDDEPHVIANVTQLIRGAEEFASGPAGPAVFFYLSEIAQVSEAETDRVIFAVSE